MSWQMMTPFEDIFTPSLATHASPTRLTIIYSCSTPVCTRRPPNIGLMLDQRRRRWFSIKPTLGDRLVQLLWNVTHPQDLPDDTSKFDLSR